MTFEREYVDGKGGKFRVVTTVDFSSAGFEKWLAKQANAARQRPRQQTTALGGAVHIICHPAK